ncbi:hypothetical protein DFA_04169 [Cavenderia fasciculata]|uniref:Uncharacterized protein n=1 Tax=Cavenderia fasciculata TaxID=261658 RepID=F4Q1H2_CACFS|nr:uncharacterized protein DFA_04169 [Cavenderia fasciculata]EGG18673.1 hypothetical protein DFA_04169 [Cavenderia fasciculata]|eukprot:XP_004366577.1 hypothetical protein DFA_04169 [Cavenderia fasciculata]
MEPHLKNLLEPNIELTQQRESLDKLYTNCSPQGLQKNKDVFLEVLGKYLETKDAPTSYIVVTLANTYYTNLLPMSMGNDKGWSFTSQFLSLFIKRLKDTISIRVRDIQNLLENINVTSQTSNHHQQHDDEQSIYFWVKSIDTLVLLLSSILERLGSFYPVSMAMIRQLLSSSVTLIRVAKPIKDFSKPFKSITLEFGDQSLEQINDQLYENIDKNLLLLKNLLFSVNSFQLSNPQNLKHLVEYCQELLNVFQEGIDSNQPVKLNIYKALKNIFILDCENKFDLLEKIDIRSTLEKLLNSCKDQLERVSNQPENKVSLKLSIFFLNTTQIFFEHFSSYLDNESLTNSMLSLYDLYKYCLESMEEKKSTTQPDYINRVNDLSGFLWKFGRHERITRVLLQQQTNSHSYSQDQKIGKLFFILSTFGNNILFQDQSIPFKLFQMCFQILETTPVILSSKTFTKYLFTCFIRLFKQSKSITSDISLYRFILKNIIGLNDYIAKISIGIWTILYDHCNDQSKKLIDLEIISFFKNLNNRNIFNLIIKKNYLYFQQQIVVGQDHNTMVVPISAMIYLESLGSNLYIILSPLVKEKIVDLLDQCFIKLKYYQSKLNHLSKFDSTNLENILTIIESISSIDIALYHKNNIIENISTLLNYPLLLSNILQPIYGSLVKLISKLNHKQILEILNSSINIAISNKVIVTLFLTNLAKNNSSLTQMDQQQLHSTLQKLFINLFKNNHNHNSWIITSSIECSINSFSNIFNNNRSKLASLIPQDNQLRDKFINNQTWFSIPNLLTTRDYLIEQSLLNQRFIKNIEKWKENLRNPQIQQQQQFNFKSQMDLMQSRGTSPAISIGEDIVAIKKLLNHVKQTLSSKPRLDNETKILVMI